MAGVPGGTFASMGAPLFIPRPLREPIAVTTARTMKLLGPVLTQVAALPMGPVSTDRAALLRVHAGWWLGCHG